MDAENKVLLLTEKMDCRQSLQARGAATESSWLHPTVTRKAQTRVWNRPGLQPLAFSGLLVRWFNSLWEMGEPEATTTT